MNTTCKLIAKIEQIVSEIMFILTKLRLYSSFYVICLKNNWISTLGFK